MKKSLPLSDTEVSVNRSIAEIIDMLEAAGFDQVGQVRNQGKSAVIAAYKNVPFRWVVDSQKIINALVNNYGDQTRRRMKQSAEYHQKIMATVKEKAERVGWRIMADYVKATCISVLYDVNTPADVFAGFLVDERGQTLGSQVGVAIESGKIPGAGLVGQVLKIDGPEVK